jgi:hypothetical protein
MTYEFYIVYFLERGPGGAGGGRSGALRGHGAHCQSMVNGAIARHIVIVPSRATTL